MQSEPQKGLFMSSSKEIQIIKKDNRLIEAKYKLSIHQQRVLYTLLDIIHTTDEDFKHYKINIADIADKFDLEKGKDLYSQMQEAVSDLVTKKITFNDGEDTVVMAWLSYARYRKGQGNVEISFHKDLKPYLLQLKSHFTQYQLSAVTQFKSSYSVRFYELLKMNEYLGKGGQFYREFTIQELRDYMQIEKGDYKLFADFRRYVIEASLKEITNFSDLKIVQVDYLKTGRAVSDVRITAEPKNQMMLDIREEQMELELANEEAKNKEPSEAIQALIALGVSEDTAKKWARKFGKGRVLQNVAYTLAMKEAGQVKSPILYLSKALENDYGKGWESEKIKQKGVVQKAKSEAHAKEQEDAKKLERERKEREEILAKFSILSDTEKEALRDMFAGTLANVILDKWRKAGNEPERKGMFLATFPIYLKQNGLI